MSIYILAGDELVPKDDIVNDLKTKYESYDFKKIYIDDKRGIAITEAKNNAFLYLSTFDMFGRGKILYIVAMNNKIGLDILEYIYEVVYDAVVVLDIRSNEYDSLKKNSFIKKNLKSFEIHNFTKLQESVRDSSIQNIINLFDTNNIKFQNQEDKLLCANFMFDNSDYNLTKIRKEIDMLKILNQSFYTFEDIQSLIPRSFNGNFYVVIDKIFLSSSKLEVMNNLEQYFRFFKKSDYQSFFNILVDTLVEYLRFSNNVPCKRKVNTFKFKRAKINIINPEELLNEIKQLQFEVRCGKTDITEEFFYILYRYLQ